jgi:antitoxin component YwqK of YwqJK toxin-antitoxin module
MHGDWTAWNPDGSKLEQGTYARGKKQGAWTEWQEDGHEKGQYLDGARDGRWVLVHGGKKSVAKFAAGQLIGGGGGDVSDVLREARKMEREEKQNAKQYGGVGWMPMPTPGGM